MIRATDMMKMKLERYASYSCENAEAEAEVRNTRPEAVPRSI